MSAFRRQDGTVSREKTLAAVGGVISAVLVALAAFGQITEEQAAQYAAMITPVVGSIWMWLFRTRDEK